MYFLFFILHGWGKRSAFQPQTIYSEIPKIPLSFLGQIGYNYHRNIRAHAHREDIMNKTLILEPQRVKSLTEGFFAVFQTQPTRFFSAPGRTEIGGNHTDH